MWRSHWEPLIKPIIKVPLSLFEALYHSIGTLDNSSKYDSYMWHWIVLYLSGCCGLLEGAPVTCLGGMKKMLEHQEDLTRWLLKFLIHQRSLRVHPDAPILQVRPACPGLWMCRGRLVKALLSVQGVTSAATMMMPNYMKHSWLFSLIFDPIKDFVKHVV